MILKVFTKEDGPETRQAKELAEKLEGEGYSVDFVDADAADSVQLMEIHDIHSFPSFVVVRENDGSPVEYWRGRIPLESDLKMFLLQ